MTEPRLLTEAETSKIEIAFLEMKALIGKANVGRSEVLKIIGDLSQEEASILMGKLHDLKKAAEEKAAGDTSEIILTARADHCFSSGGLPSFMGDFYDNEVSAVHIGARKTISKIDQMIGILTEISGVSADSCDGKISAEIRPEHFWPES